MQLKLIFKCFLFIQQFTISCFYFHIIRIIILLMDRLQQKQLDKLRKLKQQKHKQQMEVVKKLLEDDNVKTVFDYCKKILMQPLTQTLSDYSPSHLSKFLFDEQLQKAKTFFDALPDSQCTIEHFLLMMISLLKFPFQKWPYYLVGVKDMFNEIVEEKQKAITYQNFFKYVIGQVLDFKEQDQNTEFQVRFQELKKQDYLLHDNGVKKFYYSTDTKYFMTLDQSSPIIKLYNKQMRMICKFTANKQKHNKKYPNILHFDYNEMASKLGITLSDCTFSVINFSNFLTKSKYDFDLNINNQIVITFQDKMLQVYYIQMLNKWALISDMNKLYTFDLEKYKQNDPLYLTEIKLQNPDLKITYVLELVNLSMICVVTGNQVNFFNQNFSELKHSKFAHGTNIKIFRYCEQLGVFYLCGDQRFITIISLVKNSDSFIINTFDTQSKYEICTFDVFPYVGTIVSVDKNDEVRLFDINQGTCYQLANYSNIVKKQHGQIKMFKISKTEFALYETYTLVFHQQKIAIEKDTEFAFLDRTYYDEAKEQFYFSVNNQIISFSLFQGQIRKSFNLQTANVPKHDSFIIGKDTNLFIIDHQKNIYEAYLKDSGPEGQNKNYKKKVGVNNVIDMFYDQETFHAFIIGPATIHTIRNDKMNNFTVTSLLNIQDFPDIIAARYNQRQKYLLALTSNQKWLMIDAQNYKLLSYYNYHFPIDPNEHEDIMVEHFEQDQQYNIDIILNNRNEVYLMSREEPSKKLVLRIQDHLPYKLKSLKFKNMKYSQIGKNKKYLLFSDTTGYLIQFNITNLLSKNFKQAEVQKKFFRFPVKDVHKLEHENEKISSIFIAEVKHILIEKKDVLLFKGHDKEIKILAKITLQGIRTLTISTDGHIKLWQGQQPLFHLKLPDLKKITWNMDSIQRIKNQRSVNQVMQVLNKISDLKTQKATPQILLQKNNKAKANDELKEIRRFNINEPIQIEIDNKDLQQFVYRTQNINWNNFRTQTKRREWNLSKTQKMNPHPWRTKNQFRKIMQKASPENKYQKKMPNDLLSLRNSLDMKDRASRISKQYQGELVILPELNSYVVQSKNYSTKEKEPTQNQENENQQAFESCLYVKKKKDFKKINEFDQIDKQFKKKQLAMTGKKWIPRSEGKRKKEVDTSRKPKDQKVFYAPVNMIKYDPIKQIKSLFQNHNREASVNKKGRIIKIPEIKLRRQDLFNND